MRAASGATKGPMLGFLTRWAERRSDHPILMRVRREGRPVAGVELEARWYPSREVHRARCVAAQDGLCILGWRVGESRVEVTVRDQGREARFEVRADRQDPGGVWEIKLGA